MPTYLRPDGKPVVEFDPLLEIAPFVLLRRLREGRAPRLIDVRTDGSVVTLTGAEVLPEREWLPEPEEDVVLFDDDGSQAYALAQELHQQGFARVRALFGGLDLYRFALDPELLGDQTFLVRRNAQSD